jgi:hypothetical protein
MTMLHIETDGPEGETDRMAKAGAAKGIFRQCAIGYHLECSDPPGYECCCPCHPIIWKTVAKAQKRGLIP